MKKFFNVKTIVGILSLIAAGGGGVYIYKKKKGEKNKPKDKE